MKTILLLHGLESAPGGAKAKMIVDAGYKLVNPALPKESWTDSLEIAQKCVDKYKPDVIVGSSRGGALALNVTPGDAALVLIAPAWKVFGTASGECPKGTVILHSRADDIVDYSSSEDLITAAAGKAALLEVGTDHRMNAPEVLDTVLKAIAAA